MSRLRASFAASATLAAAEGSVACNCRPTASMSCWSRSRRRAKSSCRSARNFRSASSGGSRSLSSLVNVRRPTSNVCAGQFLLVAEQLVHVALKAAVGIPLIHPAEHRLQRRDHLVLVPARAGQRRGRRPVGARG